MVIEQDPADRLHTGELPAVPADASGGEPRPRKFKPIRLTLKIALVGLLIYFGVFLVVPGIRKSVSELGSVDPVLLVLGFALEMGALFCYSLLTRAALGDSAALVSSGRMFRIQLSTKALASIVPGGSAASSALGYRLLTVSGVQGADAGFALATAGLGSAIVLNVLFWLALVVSIPIRGVSPGYASAAIAGIILLGLIAALIYGLLEGRERSEKIFRWTARKLRMNEDRAAAAVKHIAGRLEDLAADRKLLIRVAGWAAANWLLDVAALWVFLRAFGPAPDVDALLVAFGQVNVLAVIPLMPGGLGTIDIGLPLALTGFGVSRATAVLGVGTYRLAQFFFPIILGGIMYTSLRVGPWSIERVDRLRRLRDLASEPTANQESALDFASRFERRRNAPEGAVATAEPSMPSAAPPPVAPPVTVVHPDVDVNHDDPTAPDELPPTIDDSDV